MAPPPSPTNCFWKERLQQTQCPSTWKPFKPTNCKKPLVKKTRQNLENPSTHFVFPYLLFIYLGFLSFSPCKNHYTSLMITVYTVTLYKGASRRCFFNNDKPRALTKLSFLGGRLWRLCWNLAGTSMQFPTIPSTSVQWWCRGHGKWRTVKLGGATLCRDNKPRHRSCAHLLSRWYIYR